MPAAWFVTNDRLVISNHLPTLERFADVIVDPEGTPSLAQDASWRKTSDALPGKAHLALYVDLERLLRGPSASDELGGLLWRWRRALLPARQPLWLVEEHTRRRLTSQYIRATGSSPDITAGAAIEEDVARHVERVRAEYRRQEDRLSERLTAWQDLRGLGVTFVAAPPVLEIELHLGTNR